MAELYGMSFPPVLQDKLTRDETRMHGAKETSFGEDIARRRAQLEQQRKEIELASQKQGRSPSSLASKSAQSGQKATKKAGTSAPAPTPKTAQTPDFSKMPDAPAAGAPFGSNIMYGAMAGSMIAPGVGTAAGAIAGGVMDALAAIEKERERKLAALQTGLATQAEGGKSLTTGTQGAVEDMIVGLRGTV
jgi:hypothetical protein